MTEPVEPPLSDYVLNGFKATSSPDVSVCYTVYLQTIWNFNVKL